MTAVVGLVGGGMLAVGVAKIVGAITHCTPGDQGEPCRWTDYWTWGARIGLFLTGDFSHAAVARTPPAAQH